MDVNSSKKEDGDPKTPKFSDLDRGWAWVILVASFGSFLVIGGSVYSVGIIHIALLERYGQDITKTSWVGALHSSMINIGGPLSTVLVDRFSCRTALVTSGFLYVIGYLATAFSPNIEVCFFTCGIIAGLGSAAYTAATVVIGFNFKQKRNLAMGLSVSGIGVGTFVMAPLFEGARELYGNTGFFVALAGLTANITVFGMLCFPSQLEIYTQKKRKEEFKLKRQDGKSETWSVIRFYLQVARKKSVICLCVARFGYCLGIHLIYVHLPKYATQMGSTSVQASFLVSISGILGVIGRILTGIAANHKEIDDILLYAGSMGIVSLATLIFPLYSESYTGQVAYAIVLGLYFGCCNVVLGSINIKFAGVECMATAIGLELFIGGIGSITGPVLAGVILDNGGTYEQSFVVAGSFILLTSISAIATVWVSSQNHSDSDESTIL